MTEQFEFTALLNDRRFDPKPLHGMTHANDPQTSITSANAIRFRLSAIQRAILEVLSARGDMTDEELENLPRFVGYRPSTVRKRRGELYQVDYIKAKGERENARGFKMTVWGV